MAAGCFSFAASMDSCYRYSFAFAGLRSTTTDLGDGTIMHCWVPKSPSESKRTLALIHGVGANAMWQFDELISPLVARFNVYVPDLVFFGDSVSTRPERSEAFQAQCVMGVMDKQGVRRMSVVGLSYGGFVGYSLAAQFRERVERVVLCCAGVCMEERDMEEGMFRAGSVEEALSLLLPQTPQKVREVMRLTFYKPPKSLPTCFLSDFIEVMCTEHVQEKKELILALHKDRKLSDLPKITQPTLIIWGEHDLIFPLELAYRLQRHLGENAELVIIKSAGHAINKEKPKELYKHIKSFLMDASLPKLDKKNNGNKVD